MPLAVEGLDGAITSFLDRFVIFGRYLDVVSPSFDSIPIEFAVTEYGTEYVRGVAASSSCEELPSEADTGLCRSRRVTCALPIAKRERWERMRSTVV